MTGITASQERVITNAVVIAATNLLFNAMRRSFPCPPLPESVVIHNGQGLRATERDDSGLYRVYAAGGLVGCHSAALTEKPFVVIGRKGSAGKPTYASSGGWVIDTAYYAQPIDDRQLDCEFLFYAISSLNFTGDIISTAIPGINRTSIYRHSIPLPPRSIQEACVTFLNAAADKSRQGPLPYLPPPLDQVRSIVSRIEELSAKISEARSARHRAIEETEVLMASEEMQIWPHHLLKDAPTLSEVTTYLARGRQSTQGISDHFLIKTQHVQMGKYVPTDLTLAAYVADRVRDEALVRNGDVLIACSAAGCLGRVAFYITNNADRTISTDTHVAIARANESRVVPEYLYAYLRGAQGQLQLRSREKGDWRREKIGFRLTELNVADMRRLPVPVPPVPEQRRIVAYLDDLQAKADALKKLQEETAKELNAIMPSILSKAFSGEL